MFLFPRSASLCYSCTQHILPVLQHWAVPFFSLMVSLCRGYLEVDFSPQVLWSDAQYVRLSVSLLAAGAAASYIALLNCRSRHWAQITSLSSCAHVAFSELSALPPSPPYSTRPTPSAAHFGLILARLCHRAKMEMSFEELLCTKCWCWVFWKLLEPATCIVVNINIIPSCSLLESFLVFYQLSLICLHTSTFFSATSRPAFEFSRLALINIISS